MHKKKGSVGLEFVVAISLFLVAFWFIYLQSTVLLLPKTFRNDVRQPGAEFVSTKLISDAGYESSIGTPEDWDAGTGYDELGFALYSGGTKSGILDRDKLTATNGTNCEGLKLDVFEGEFAYEVHSNLFFACNAKFNKNAYVQRPIYVKSGGAYWKGVMRVWIA